MTSTAVIASPHPRSDAGGTERFCNLLADVLEARGYRCELVGPPPGPSRQHIRFGLEYLWKARAVRRAAPPADLVVTTNFFGWPHGWQAPRVHVYCCTMAAMAGQRPAINRRDRVRSAVGGGLADALGARGAAVVAVSKRVAAEARRFYRVRPTVIAPGVDTDLFTPRDRGAARERLGLRPDRRYALFVGRGEPGKNPHVALEACRSAGFELLVAGVRPVAGSRPLGVLGRDELAWAYAAAEAVVLPSSYEGFAYVSLEGLASGVPVVMTPTGWAPELLQAVPAYAPLVLPPEPAAIAAILRRIDTAQVAGAVDAARAHVLRHHTLAAFSKAWMDFLDRAAGAPTHAQRW